MAADSGKPTVLVVEDERDLADLYAAWLDDEYDVRRAYDYEAALEAADADVDVALLDRRLQERSGDEVLAAVRERGLDCRVAMVTGVDPGFDVLDMGFDDYLVKPVAQDELREVVEALLRRSEYDDLLQEQFAIASKLAALEARYSDVDLEASEEYNRLRERFEEMRERTDATVAEFDDEDFVLALQTPDTEPA